MWKRNGEFGLAENITESFWRKNKINIQEADNTEWLRKEHRSSRSHSCPCFVKWQTYKSIGWSWIHWAYNCPGTSLTDNIIGMYPSPISVDVGGSYPCGTSSLYKAWLHTPVDNITIIRNGLHAKEVHYSDDILFLASRNGPLLAVEFEEYYIWIKLK